MPQLALPISADFDHVAVAVPRLVDALPLSVVRLSKVVAAYAGGSLPVALILMRN